MVVILSLGNRMKKIIVLVVLVICSVIVLGQTTSDITEDNWEYLNKTVLVPVYESYSCNVTRTCELNESKECKPETTEGTCIRLLSEEEVLTDEKIGIKIDDEEYVGEYNVESDVLVEWSIPIGDRNMAEYGRCRTYEIEKGVCTETIIKKSVKEIGELII